MIHGRGDMARPLQFPPALAILIGCAGTERPSAVDRRGCHRPLAASHTGGFVRPVNQHHKLQEWVEEMARLCEPDQIVWIDGSEEEKERLTQEAAATGEVIPLNPGKAARLPLPSHGRQRRRPDRGPDLHLHHAARRRRTDQQLDVAGRGLPPGERDLRRRHAGADDVRDPLLDGAGGLALQQDRRRADRQHLRGAEHADHDPRRRRGAEAARHRRRVHQVPAQQGRPGHQAPADPALPRGQHDLERRLGLRRQRAAGQEVPRPAHRQLSGQAGRLAGRAHADHGRGEPRGPRRVRRRRLPQRLRQDQPRHDDSARRPEGQGLPHLDRRRRHRLDADRHRRPALGHQPGNRLLRRGAGHELEDQPEHDEDHQPQDDLHERRAGQGRHACGGKAARASRPPKVGTGKAGPGSPA